MLKLIGAAIILSSCGVGGLKIAHVYQERTRVLRFLQNGLNLLETEINYVSTPLPLALLRVSEKLTQTPRILFGKAADILQKEEGVTAKEAWERGIAELNHRVPLTREEIGILSVFGCGLGISSKEDQLKNISLAREQLRMAEKAADEAREKNQRVWQYLGFGLGAVVVLILL